MMKNSKDTNVRIRSAKHKPTTTYLKLPVITSEIEIVALLSSHTDEQQAPKGVHRSRGVHATEWVQPTFLTLVN